MGSIRKINSSSTTNDLTKLYHNKDFDLSKTTLKYIRNIDSLYLCLIDLASVLKLKDKRAKTIKSLSTVRIFITACLDCVLHKLFQMTNSRMKEYTLRCLRLLCMATTNNMKIKIKFLHLALSFLNSSNVRIYMQALLLVNELIFKLPKSALFVNIKNITKKYLRDSIFQKTTHLMHFIVSERSMIGLYNIDTMTSYNLLGNYLCQMASTLNPIVNRKKLPILFGSVTKISPNNKNIFVSQMYKWKFFREIELICCILVVYSEKIELSPLIDPIIKLIYGLLYLKVPSFTLSVRIWLIRLLNRFSQLTGVFIPTLSLLTQLLSFKYFHFDPRYKLSSMCINKVSKTSINNLKHIFLREELLSQIFEEVSKLLTLFAYHVSFPEFCFTTQIRLEKFTKVSTSIKKNQNINLLLYSIAHTAQMMKHLRDYYKKSVEKFVESQSYLNIESSITLPIKLYYTSSQNNSKKRLSIFRQNL